jgi:hypothetical protein
MHEHSRDGNTHPLWQLSPQVRQAILDWLDRSLARAQSDNDTRWFEVHPEVRYRIRDVSPVEWQRRLCGAFDEVERLSLIVVLSPSRRLCMHLVYLDRLDSAHDLPEAARTFLNAHDDLEFARLMAGGQDVPSDDFDADETLRIRQP